MTAASDILNALTLLDGVHLYSDHDGNLKGRGDQGTIAARLPEIRAHKAELIALLTQPRRLWLVVRPDGTATSHSLNPPATLGEMQRWYPGAEIHPDHDHDSEERDAA